MARWRVRGDHHLRPGFPATIGHLKAASAPALAPRREAAPQARACRSAHACLLLVTLARTSERATARPCLAPLHAGHVVACDASRNSAPQSHAVIGKRERDKLAALLRFAATRLCTPPPLSSGARPACDGVLIPDQVSALANSPLKIASTQRISAISGSADASTESCALAQRAAQPCKPEHTSGAGDAEQADARGPHGIHATAPGPASGAHSRPSSQHGRGAATVEPSTAGGSG